MRLCLALGLIDFPISMNRAPWCGTIQTIRHKRWVMAQAASRAAEGESTAAGAISPRSGYAPSGPFKLAIELGRRYACIEDRISTLG